MDKTQLITQLVNAIKTAAEASEENGVNQSIQNIVENNNEPLSDNDLLSAFFEYWV